MILGIYMILRPAETYKRDINPGCLILALIRAPFKIGVIIVTRVMLLKDIREYLIRKRVTVS